MPTFLAERTSVSNTLGRTDGATANTIRDNAINEVRQFDIANAYPFSWLEKTASLTTDTDGQDDLPADFNVSHRPKLIIDENNSVYRQVDKEAFHKYGAGDHVYFIDYNSDTDLWQINTTEASADMTMTYYFIPATLEENTDVDQIPDLIVIKYLACARLWLGAERDETNYDRFSALGQQRLQMLINRDKKANAQRLPKYNWLRSITRD